MYAQVDVIVDGALEESEVFTDYLLLDQYIAELEEDVRSHGYPTEVYVLYHEHPLEDEQGEPIECECHQYVTDHQPAYSWNTEGDLT